ncbi:MAG: family 20 glycosylhydrolase [Flavobacteriales bacterium]
MRSFFPALLLMASCADAQIPPEPTLIPRPVELVLGKGTLALGCPWSVEASPAVEQGLADLLRSEVQAHHPSSVLDCLVPMRITLELSQPDTVLPPESYWLTVKSDGIILLASTQEGLFRGSRTLVQLLEQGRETGTVQCLTILDHPRFGWRGMHLDVARHFFSVEFVKKYIDLLARYKMNSFHWHLTDDQGWRIEIKKYPKLTEVGAWRSGSQYGPYSRREYDSIPYGGFYTQDQIREVVAYAMARHITVVPEIEMPGHAMAALASYPQLGCSGGPYEVQKGWGVYDDVFCAGNDSVFTMMQEVLAEVMDLFPSEYIHVGGDECPKERWKTCPKCQARMKAEGLKDEHELQSYFVQRIEKFVNGKGRKIIGWDEILEGGLAPNAAVMSWQGTAGGIAAAKQGHNVVMSPGSHCYFDHYQGDPVNEPLAIGGYTTVQKTYGYEPVPAELSAEEAKYILGAQGNVWTEYITTPEQVEYMAVPRMLALAEVLWSPKEQRDEADFIRRLEAEFPRLDAIPVNYARSLYNVGFDLKPGKRAGEIEITLKAASPGTIQFNQLTDQNQISQGSIMYGGPIYIARSWFIRTALVSDAGITGPTTFRNFVFNKATAQKITLDAPPNERYSEGGAFTLVDGITAGEKRVSTEWLGWLKGVAITIDLGSEQDIAHVGIGALNETYSWIHLPRQVDFAASSNGTDFKPLGSAKVEAIEGRNVYAIDKSVKARYMRITVKHPGKIPEGYPGAGKQSWLFLDEIDIH